MFGVKISFPKPSSEGDLSVPVNLQNILRVIGESAVGSQWRCLNLWYIAMREETIHECRQRRRDFSGKDLLAFAASVHQTIDGEFIAKKDGSNKAWLIIKAVDSSWWEVWSTKPKVLEEIEKGFAKVSAIPDTASNKSLDRSHGKRLSHQA
jgi:hypothetical protein